MSKPKKASPSPVPVSASMSAETCERIFRLQAASALKWFEEAKANAIACMEGNPVEALEAWTVDIVRRQAAYLVWQKAEKVALEHGGDRPFFNQVARVLAWAEEQLERLIESHPWEKKSTCAVANAIAMFTATARAEELRNVRSLMRKFREDLAK